MKVLNCFECGVPGRVHENDGVRQPADGDPLVFLRRVGQ